MVLTLKEREVAKTCGYALQGCRLKNPQERAQSDPSFSGFVRGYGPTLNSFFGSVATAITGLVGGLDDFQDLQ